MRYALVFSALLASAFAQQSSGSSSSASASASNSGSASASSSSSVVSSVPSSAPPSSSTPMSSTTTSSVVPPPSSSPVKVGCSQSSDCGSSQYCGPHNICYSLPSGACVANVDCANSVCSFSANNSYYGYCNANYPSCQSSSDCSSTQYCATGDGRCADLPSGACKAAVDCKSGICNIASGQPYGSCNATSTTCHDNSACPAGTYCATANGICATLPAGDCVASVDCGSNQYCNYASSTAPFGSCATKNSTCTTCGTPCTAAYQCQSGICNSNGFCNATSTSCQGDSQCGPSQYCATAQAICADLPTGSCTANYQCSTGTCNFSNSSSFGTCSSVNTNCQSNQDCQTGFYCASADKQCAMLPTGDCTASVQCPSGFCSYSSPSAPYGTCASPPNSGALKVGAPLAMALIAGAFAIF